MTDSNGRLGVANALALFMDTAALATDWGEWMDRGVFFITVTTTTATAATATARSITATGIEL